MLLRLARLFQLGNLIVADVPQVQPLLGRLVKPLRAFQDRLVSFLLRFIAHLEHVHELILRCEQIRAVDGENRRFLLDQLPAREDEELLHITFNAADIIPMPLLVVSDHADRTDGVRERPFLNRRVGHPNLLLALDRHGELARLVVAAHVCRTRSIRHTRVLGVCRVCAHIRCPFLLHRN